MSDIEEFRKLAAKAAGEAYDPRADRCFPFCHRWSMWDRDGFYQFRRCIRCGKWQTRCVVSLFAPCRHMWDTFNETDLRDPFQPNASIGRVYRQHCRHCGDYRSKTLTN